MENFYQVLGVKETSSQDEIKKAYRKLAIEHHPDKGGSEETFKKISEAYDTLGDEVKKVIVFKQNNQVHIYKCDEDVQEGTAVNLGQPDGEAPSEPITESETPIVEE